MSRIMELADDYANLLAESERENEDHGTVGAETIQWVDDTRAALQAEVEKLEKDAARYRWLREQHWTKGGVVVTNIKFVSLGAMCPTEGLLDSTIDKAMETANGQGN